MPMPSACFLYLHAGFAAALLTTGLAGAATFHLDSANGNDANSGLTADQPWRSLAKVNALAWGAGDSIVLKRGCRFTGGLSLVAAGTADEPVTIGAYGDGDPPVIDARGHLAGVHLKAPRHVVVRDLAITADGGKTVDGSPPGKRFGVYVDGTAGNASHVTIEDLVIRRIYPEKGSPHEGRNSTTHLGVGVGIEGAAETDSGFFTVRRCVIEETGFKGISLSRVHHVEVLDNRLTDIGGPGIQPGRVDDLLVRGNTVVRSGSSLDPRMHARGSGIWPWTCSRVTIEKNRFFHARGKGDSCGIHIDYNCTDVLVQYNLSVDNEGGFVEILGNNRNSAYRYNVSVNDGSRVKGRDKAFQEGKILMTSGYVGNRMPKTGPFDSYIHNNTVFVKEGTRSCFSIAPTTQGLLVANNIFHILGKTVNVLDDQDARKDKRAKALKRTVVGHNLYVTGDVLPENLPFTDSNPFVGDAGFAKPGGLRVEDYLPRRAELVRDRGMRIEMIPGAAGKPSFPLEVTEDILGNPIRGLPDLGAIEIP